MLFQLKTMFFKDKKLKNDGYKTNHWRFHFRFLKLKMMPILFILINLSHFYLF